MRPPRAQDCRCGATSPADEPVTLPLPEIQIFGGGAHAGRRVDVQDFMVMPLGATTFAEALEMTAEVYRAAGELMRERGQARRRRRRGRLVAGVRHQRGGARAAGARDRARRLHAGRRRRDLARHRRASEFGSATAATGSASRARELDSRRDGRDCCSSWLERYPIASIEDPFAEDDPRRLVALHAGGGRHACRSSATISS